ncbi:hypothetical protein [Sphingomonas sp. RS2018]
MTDDRDLTPDNGRAPPFAKPEPALGEIGTGDGYSGQEYDSVGQGEWRAADVALNVAPDGVAKGTGSPGEEIDRATPGSADQPGPTAAKD